MSDPLTAEEVEQVRSFHSAKDPDGIICNCGMFTPCHAQRLIATIDRAAPPSDAAAPLREAAQTILDRCLDVFPEDWVEPESSFAMSVTLRARDVYALRAALTPTADTLDPTCCPDCGEPWPVCSCPTADDPSEYGRLLAERDRLIASGVDPADLDIPDAP